MRNLFGPSAPVLKRRRQTALLRLIRRQAAANQAQIVQRLRRLGISATQASISRDLRELGLIKLNGRYVPPQRASAPPAAGETFEAELITFAGPAGANLVVVRTAVGAASAVAVGIDRLRSPDIVGTIAGDDAIFIAVPSRSAQGRVIARLNGLRRSRAQPGPRPAAAPAAAEVQ